MTTDQSLTIFAAPSNMLSIEKKTRFTLHGGSIYTLAPAEDENSFLSAGSEGVIIKWNVLEPDKAVAVARVEGQVFAMLMLPGYNHLAIGTMSGGLHILSLEEKKEAHYITYHEQSVFDIRRYGQKLLVASKDGTLSVWTIGDYKLERIVSISDLSLRMIDIHPSQDEAAIGCSDNKIYILDLHSWNIKAILEGPENSVFSVRYLPDGNHLIAGSRDAQLYVFDTVHHRLKHQIKAHLYTINDIQVIRNEKYFATASRDKTIRIWNLESFELVKAIDKAKYEGHINSVNRLLWLTSHQSLISASDDRSIIQWSIEEM